MKKFIKRSVKLLEKLISCFNFSFFFTSLIIWLYLTISNLLTHPFDISLLWSAFNDMYAQLAFKVGCIALIIGNGLQTIQSWIGQYYQLKEYKEHFTTLGKIVKPKKS